MRASLQFCLLALLVCSLSACGNKGALKSPSQIATQEAKQARKDAKTTQQPPNVAPDISATTQPPVSNIPPAQEVPHPLAPVQKPAADAPPSPSTGTE